MTSNDPNEFATKKPTGWNGSDAQAALVTLAIIVGICLFVALVG